MEETIKVFDNMMDTLRKVKQEFYWNRSLTLRQIKLAYSFHDPLGDFSKFEKILVAIWELETGEEDLPRCETCGGMTTPVFDNLGYSEPDPTKMEIVGYKCGACGHEQKDAEFMADKEELARDIN